jgi:hypothetical protein
MNDKGRYRQHGASARGPARINRIAGAINGQFSNHRHSLMPWLLYAVPKTLREETLQVIDSTRAKKTGPGVPKPDDSGKCIGDYSESILRVQVGSGPTSPIVKFKSKFGLTPRATSVLAIQPLIQIKLHPILADPIRRHLWGPSFLPRSGRTRTSPTCLFRGSRKRCRNQQCRWHIGGNLTNMVGRESLEIYKQASRLRDVQSLAQPN